MATRPTQQLTSHRHDGVWDSRNRRRIGSYKVDSSARNYVRVIVCFLEFFIIEKRKRRYICFNLLCCHIRIAITHLAESVTVCVWLILSLKRYVWYDSHWNLFQDQAWHSWLILKAYRGCLWLHCGHFSSSSCWLHWHWIVMWVRNIPFNVETFIGHAIQCLLPKIRTVIGNRNLQSDSMI